MFSYNVELKQQPVTRRGILSTVSSAYDPLGFASPVILSAREILQDLCKQKVGWDDSIPSEQQRKWVEWSSEIHKLEEFCINICLKPKWFEKPTVIQINHFADASSMWVMVQRHTYD